LLQHAHNPVDWYPWGSEAFERAKRENKPILLSIGYSACHWCHVMERESFEDEETARLMNEHFVNVKVDREERPDVDEVYMNCAQLLTGHGGWPLTVFLTPDGEPFYAGTYFPPEDRHGLPSFRRVLLAVAQAWRERPGDLRQSASRLREALRRLALPPTAEADLPDGSLLEAAVESLARACDPRHGGIGRAPKFPNPSVFSLFLRFAHTSGRAEVAELAGLTLRKMADGGIHDQLGGGFHRYSVDERWLVPHFEKMLYDNAQLARLYLDGFRAVGDPSFLEVAQGILGYLEREMRSPQGGFYAAQDADSEGEEGRFFLWTRSEVLQALGEELGELFCRVYDVTDVGNFEGRNILHRTLSDEQAARLFRCDVETLRAELARARAILLERRNHRPKPFRDEKVLLAWTALAISAFVDAWWVTGNGRFLQIAIEALQFVEAHMTRDGRLLHAWKDGEAKIPAFLDDTAAYGLALLDAFEATSEAKLLDRAEELAAVLEARFWDDRAGAFWYTSPDHEELIARSHPAYDGAVPSGNSLAVHFFLRLHAVTERPELLDRADRVLRTHGRAMGENPFGHAHLLAALDFRQRGAKSIAIVAPGGTSGAGSLLQPLGQFYEPNRTVFCYDPAAPPARVPAFAVGKSLVEGRPTAYVCHGFACSAPVTEAEDLRRTLEVSR
jgi:hypothetical protein